MIFIGIPILNRADLLWSCLAAIDLAADVLIVNNNSIDPQFAHSLERARYERLNIRVLHQARNLGVAASWNLILREGFAAGHQRVFIGSNDTVLRPGSLAAALAAPTEPDVRVWFLCSHNFFLIDQRAIADVGWFDENFYPAYKEDQDYSYRMRLAGVREVNVDGAGGDHFGSATIRSNPLYMARNAVTHGNWNQNHYLMKWGGDAGAEKFTHPYDKPEWDHRFWPDPGGSIEHRDWDRGHLWKRK